MTNIVMLVHNRLNLTRQALESLFWHTKTTDYNLTIVDDDSDDFRVKKLLSALWWPPDWSSVLTVSNSSHVLSQLKNLGVAWSEQRFGRGGDWLCLCDNDVYFTDGWLPKMIAVAESSERAGYALWGGQAHPFHHGQPSVVPGLDEHDCLAGTHWLTRWDTWERFGPLSRTTAPGVCQSEDIEFTNRMQKYCRIGVMNPPVVYDCSITQTDGKPAPGADLKPRMPGVIYE